MKLDETTAPPPDSSAPTVLCVDDEPEVLNALQRQLRKEPYRLITVDSPSLALDLIHRRSINVVLTDERMPSLTGTELLRMVRLRSPQVARGMLTGFPNRPAVWRESGESIECLIAKPWSDGDLRETIRRLLAQSETRRPERSRDVQEWILPLDCEGRGAAEVMGKIDLLMPPHDLACSGVVLLLRNLRESSEPVERSVRALLAMVEDAKRPHWAIVDPTGMAEANLQWSPERARRKAWGTPRIAPRSEPTLLIEHREDVIEMFRALFETLLWPVRIVGSIAEGLRLLEEDPFAGVVADLDVPDADGKEGAHRLAVRAPLTPTVFLVRPPRPPILDAWGRVLEKPYRIRELLEALGGIPTTPNAA